MLGCIGSEMGLNARIGCLLWLCRYFSCYSNETGILSSIKAKVEQLLSKEANVQLRKACEAWLNVNRSDQCETA